MGYTGFYKGLMGFIKILNKNKPRSSVSKDFMPKEGVNRVFWEETEIKGLKESMENEGEEEMEGKDEINYCKPFATQTSTV